MTAANYAAWEIDPVGFKEVWPAAQKLRLFARYAILAPSGHNTQPWHFQFHNDEVLLRDDPTRCLDFSGQVAGEPHTSLGACLETMRMAAEGFGDELLIELRPPDNVVASIRVGERIEARPELLAAILGRVSNRSPFGTDKLPQDFLTDLFQNNLEMVSLHLVTDRSVIEFLAQQTSLATIAMMSGKEFRSELSNWVRNNLTRRFDGMPAFVQGMPLPPSLLAKLIIRNTDISKGQAKRDAGRVRASSAIAAICTATDGQLAFLQAGRMYARVCVLAQSYGIASSGAGAAAVDPTTRRAVALELHKDGEEGEEEGSPVALIRLGRTVKTAHRSPRWPLPTVSDGL
jgi:hypothetical protein